MKKITSIIFTLAIAACLTACSTIDEPPQNSADTSSDNKQIVIDQESKPDNSVQDNEKDDGNTSEDKDKENSTPNESDTSDDTTEDKTEDTDKDKSDNDTDNEPDNSKTPENDNTSKTVTLPLKEYPAGSYFTYDGKACTDHSSCSWTTDCNCINFDMSIQSPGFAKYVYYQITGKHVSLENKTAMDIDLTAQTAKSSLMGLPLGTYVAVEQGNDRFHAFIITGTDENGISVYQANYGGGCVVSTATYSWADFADRFPHLDYYVK